MSNEHKCPNCGAFLVERSGPLERQLAEARGIISQLQSALLASDEEKEQAQRERDALKATLAQAREALTLSARIVHGACVELGSDCEDDFRKCEDGVCRKNTSALAALNVREE